MRPSPFATVPRETRGRCARLFDRDGRRRRGYRRLIRTALALATIALSAAEAATRYPLPERDAKIVFDPPGLEGVVPYRSKVAQTHTTIEFAYWQRSLEALPVADVFLLEVEPHVIPRDIPSLRELTDKIGGFIEGTKRTFGAESKYKNVLGEISYMKFKANRIDCVSFRQMIWRGLHLGDNMLWGYYCGRADQKPTDDFYRGVLDRLGVKGIAVPPR